MGKALLSIGVLLTVILGTLGCQHGIPTPEPYAAWKWQPPAPPPPPMAWVPAGPYRQASRTPENVTAIIIHTTEGRFNDELTFEENQNRNFAGVVNYFKDNDRNVSAHYVMGPNGEICQMVNETDVAHTQTYYNGRGIGIECAGWSSRPETWTPEMMESLVNLCAYLCTKWEVPAYHPEGTAYEGEYRMVINEETQRFTGQGLVGHFQVQPWNKSDPGDHFPWEEFAVRVQDRIREFGAEPIELPPPAPEELVVVEGLSKSTVAVGEEFSYSLTIVGTRAGEVALDGITFPKFELTEEIEVLADPVKVESGEDRVVYEVRLRAKEAGLFGITASRVRHDGTWFDTGTSRVKVE